MSQEEVKQEEKQLTPEEQAGELRKVSEMRHKALTRLVTAHIQNYGATLIATNGVSYQEKLSALKSLVRAVEFAFDFGIGVTNPEIAQGGKLAKQENEMAGILVQTLDNRMLLIADNMRKQELEEQKEPTMAERVEAAEQARLNGEISTPEEYFDKIENKQGDT